MLRQRPELQYAVASGLSTSGLMLVGDAGSNVLREFWPEIRHPRRRLNEARGQAMAPAPDPLLTAEPAQIPAQIEVEADIEVIELGAEECRECTPAIGY